MIAIIDYGMGNLRSVQGAMKHLGSTDYYLAAQPEQLEQATKIILPGVGAYGAASTALFGSQAGGESMARALQRKAGEGVPLLGICLGMQMLFEKGVEFGEHPGLGFFPGAITRFQHGMKVPHMGWNSIDLRNDCPLFRGLGGDVYAYFAHSYMAACEHAPDAPPHAAGVTGYGSSFISVAWSGNVYGTQFHPEKSGAAGLRMLKNFLEVA